MTTYREAVYMCFDLLKGMSDDFSFTEDHIAYLLDKYRALLLKQRYGNDPKKHVPYSNYQTIKLTLDEKGSNKLYYKSTATVPFTMQIGIPRITTDDYYDIEFEFTSRERLPFVGSNRFLNKITYAAIDHSNKLLIKKNDYTNNINEIHLTAIFENPRDVDSTDGLDANLPIEESLITTLIELVVKEIAGSMYIPSDDINNATDDKSSLAGFVQSNMKSDLAQQLNK